ncbi:LOW QUALITY PROTEIN: putative defensin-like protein 298 [Brassica rapa]|uniref:LOW QUALITY PROTEIN: putative defensin-like protein 298 n=1 Tax=Brassica campestris TaxID=3711 RepID=UPI00142DC2ED|nr:LOW QUALITY PROTEIN: putative defensin-like protein 298 [Brassica rapa]
MASKTALFILFALFLSCILLVSVPGVEAQLIITCKTAADCKSKLFCSNGSPQCVVRQCQCASVKPVKLMRTNTMSIKTIFDCASHQWSNNLYACIEGKCTSLPL